MVMEEGKNMTVRRAFVERMRRDGRGREWFQRCKDVMARTGKNWMHSSYIAMKEMGYQGPKAEWKIYYDYKRLEGLNRVRRQIALEREQIMIETTMEDFEACVRGLPPVAPVSQEIQWISIHPAMNRRDRDKDQTKAVILTGVDVLMSTAGRAPSQRAVRQLQHWANAPREFYKQLLGEDKKRTEDKEGRSTETDSDLGEVERLLKQVKESRHERGWEPESYGGREVDCGDEGDGDGLVHSTEGSEV